MEPLLVVLLTGTVGAPARVSLHKVSRVDRARGEYVR
jgi:hypothetical protein